MADDTDTSHAARCSWCGTTVAPGDGFRAAEHPGERVAVFCRLEHVVPWAMQGPYWEAGMAEGRGQRAERCSECGQALGDVRVELVRHRGEHRIADAFCSVDHLAAWAKGGGRWR
ncbi:MAG: hypothetical protein QOI64_1123 [Solirubrobacteraceae bacterium]|nr:hypothetical protein [Solirubrobacteraceae bacterium]